MSVLSGIIRKTLKEMAKKWDKLVVTRTFVILDLGCHATIQLLQFIDYAYVTLNVSLLP